MNKFVWMFSLALIIPVVMAAGCQISPSETSEPTPTPTPVPSASVTELPDNEVGWLEYLATNEDLCIERNDFPDRFPVMEESYMEYNLSDETELVQILCEAGAYNLGYVFIVVRDGQAEVVTFNEFLEGSDDFVPTSILFGASFDEVTRIIVTDYKGRGLGDCGTSGRYLWTGDEFVLTAFRAKWECDGNMGGEWPIIYEN
ncbi:DUF1176 domain-containing protein [Patescibacteria group bacterium]